MGEKQNKQEENKESIEEKNIWGALYKVACPTYICIHVAASQVAHTPQSPISRCRGGWKVETTSTDRS